MSELQSAYAPNSLFAPMDDLETYIRGTWDLRHPHDFFTPPLPFLEEYRFSDPWLIFALFSLAKTTSLDMARKALREVLTRDEHEGEVTARDVQEARDYVIKNMEPGDLQRYNNVTVPGLRRDERSRPVEQPAYRDAASDHVSDYAIETPNLVADPPGATFDEQLGLRDEAVQLLGAQEEYYEAVRRKMLSRYTARVQKYEREVIQIRKRVAGGEGTRYNGDDERRGRGNRGHEREIRDGRRR
ncbi:hypothetical protein J4E85_007560 [Alternaria conjuncta]|uniref:uncharacterized protein n=1 Tax=Alternaria conjuncta TaxID=181017 RepID=UPI002220F560|nr:uncharacterized protein J4E85_007560 [Alternaria conjuncta]KAI4925681.1 hypothetical protein J4E85_007560 [Alternaria conjuncta]